MNNYPKYHIFLEIAAQRDFVNFTVALLACAIVIYVLAVYRKSPAFMPAMRTLLVIAFYICLVGSTVWSLFQ